MGGFFRENFGEGKIKKVLLIISFLVSNSGLIGFTCFIFEESLQLQTFSAFIYVNGEDWEGLQDHVELMEKTQDFAGMWIKGIGWVTNHRAGFGPGTVISGRGNLGRSRG